MSDNKPHDPTRWSHTTSELAEARTPPPQGPDDPSRQNNSLRDSGQAGSIRSSQYSGTEEDENEIGVEISPTERNILNSSSNAAKTKRLQQKAGPDPLAAIGATRPAGDTVAESLKIDPENLNVKASLSSGNRARRARLGFRLDDDDRDDGLDIEPANILEDSGEGKGAEDDGFKRNTFGK
jgi:hypothetical protein